MWQACPPRLLPFAARICTQKGLILTTTFFGGCHIPVTPPPPLTLGGRGNVKMIEGNAKETEEDQKKCNT